MKFKQLKKFLSVLSISGILLALSFSSQAAPIDEKIKQIFSNDLSSSKSLLGCGVVNTETGEIVSTWIKNPEIGTKKEVLAYTLTNIIRGVQNSLEQLGYTPKFMGIRFKEGVFFIKPISRDLFIGCMYSPSLNPAEERERFLKVSRKIAYEF